MRITPKTLLASRLVGVLLVGLGACETAAMLVHLVEPRILSDVWAGRAGGPFALLTRLIVEWVGVLGRRNLWQNGPALLATVAGVWLVYRTRRALACVPGRMLR